MTEAKSKRRWFSFSIRDLFWLTTTTTLAAGWYIDHRQLLPGELSSGN
jgi:hypothetical protein